MSENRIETGEKRPAAKSDNNDGKSKKIKLEMKQEIRKAKSRYTKTAIVEFVAKLNKQKTAGSGNCTHRVAALHEWLKSGNEEAMLNMPATTTEDDFAVVLKNMFVW